jgi:hypothetical protein
MSERSKIMAVLGEPLYGSFLIISNTNLNGKSYRNFQPINEKSSYKYHWHNNDVDLRYPIVLDLLKEVIPEKSSKKGIMDIELSTEETVQIKNIFEREINHILSIRKPAKDGYTITVFGKEIQVDTRNEIHDMDLTAFNNIYLIAKECLDEDKPMYLSID